MRRAITVISNIFKAWKNFMRKAYLISFPRTLKRTYTATRNSTNSKKRFMHSHKAGAETKLSVRSNSVTLTVSRKRKLKHCVSTNLNTHVVKSNSAFGKMYTIAEA
jgi:hypothetical protein